MDVFARAESCGEVMAGWWHGGVVAVAVYAIGDVLSGLVYDGYSWADQAISELSAFGSPVRPLMVPVNLTHNVLVLAFGIGVLRGACRWVGILQVVGLVVVGLTTHRIWAMSSRDIETGFNDTMHIALSMVFGVLVAAMMVLSAVTYRGWFRVYAARDDGGGRRVRHGVRCGDARHREERHAVGGSVRADNAYAISHGSSSLRHGDSPRARRVASERSVRRFAT